MGWEKKKKKKNAQRIQVDGSYGNYPSAGLVYEAIVDLGIEHGV